MMFSFNLEWLALKYENPWFILKCLLPSLTEKDTRSCNRKPKLVRDKRVCKDKYNAIYFQLSKTSKKIHCCALLWPQYHQTTRRFVVQGHLSSVRVTNTCVMGVVPAASRGSPCRVERKVSEPSKPKPDRKAPITGITDSSRSNQWTKACRYCSLNTLKNRRSRRYSAQGQHWYCHEEIYMAHPFTVTYFQIQETTGPRRHHKEQHKQTGSVQKTVCRLFSQGFGHMGHLVLFLLPLGLRWYGQSLMINYNARTEFI